MSYETVDYRAADGIGRIVLNRPARLNAINTQLVADLRAAVAAANDDPEVRVLVLSGA
ncbi:MAG: enoyl-CoA hydratase-related protein, partial [Dehalococcoidia bacterium]